MARDETMRSKFLPGQDARETTSASIVRLCQGWIKPYCPTIRTRSAVDFGYGFPTLRAYISADDLRRLGYSRCGDQSQSLGRPRNCQCAWKRNGIEPCSLIAIRKCREFPAPTQRRRDERNPGTALVTKLERLCRAVRALDQRRMPGCGMAMSLSLAGESPVRVAASHRPRYPLW